MSVPGSGPALPSHPQPPAHPQPPSYPETPIRPAATVILVRDSAHGPEVFLLERVAGMEFAPGMTVFPGGAVDSSDPAGDVWDGPPIDWWAHILGRDPNSAKGLVTAAMRELYEETGVLLVNGLTAQPDAVRRVELDQQRLSWSEFLTDHGLTADTDLLRPWSRWITPPGRTRRYDTYFFVAEVPPGQEPDAVTTEAVAGHWSTPQAALTRAVDGQIQLMRPTRTVLTEIAGFSSTAEILAATVGLPLPPTEVGRGERLIGGRYPRRTSPTSRVLLAPNPGPMTLAGTNSYLLAAADSPTVVVVDPGPDDPAHLSVLAGQGTVELILITHRHADHTAGSAALRQATGAPVRALDPAFCIGGTPLQLGERILAAGLTIDVLATPGHTSDSVCFVLPDDGPTGSVLTGDTVLGHGTTVLDSPDGTLADYLSSLDLLVDLGPRIGLPAHGPVLADLSITAADYRSHRGQRLDQVRTALSSIAGNPQLSSDVDSELVAAVTAAVYSEVPADVQRAARRSVAAQLEYLINSGEAGTIISKEKGYP